MRISKTTAVTGAVFIAFVFFCLGYFASGGGGRPALSVESETAQAVSVPGFKEAPEAEAAGAQSAARETEKISAEAPESGGEDYPVNINAASAEELETLPGIGPALSQAILAYREENGPFGSPADIKRVNGIGDGRYEDIKDLIRTD